MGAFSMESVIMEFEAATQNAGEVQRETLLRILEENGEAEYLKGFAMGGSTDTEIFKARVPLSTHQDLEPYIRRIANGDGGPILTGNPITSMSLSSGTTQGKPKFVPFNDYLVKSTMQIYQTSYAFRNREFPIGNGKALQFIYGSKPMTTEGGLVARTATTNLFNNKEYMLTMRDIQSQPCSPNEVVFASDFHQSLYCHLLCGVIFADQVQLIFSTFAHSIFHAFCTFEEVWQDICSDIREGVLSSRITIPEVREAVSRLLKPDPELADSIRHKCLGLSNWYGLVPALWPNAKYVYGIMTGSMEPYSKKLRHYAGDVPLISADYGSSEGWIAANIDPKAEPESATFVVLPDIGYFEFIPLSDPCEDPAMGGVPSTVHYTESEPVGLTEVEVGRDYEIVITNSAGFYRYRLGDIVKVTGFHNSAPEIKFVCRRSLLLSLNIDKNTEKDLQLAVEEASSVLAAEKVDIVDFTSTADRSTDPGHYVVFLELNREAPEEVLHSCCNRLDQSFRDAGYIGSRKTGAIGPLELRVLQCGTFGKILDHFLSLGAAVSQFKVPRCVSSTNSKVLQILGSNVMESYFSTAYDRGP